MSGVEGNVGWGAVGTDPCPPGSFDRESSPPIFSVPLLENSHSLERLEPPCSGLSIPSLSSLPQTEHLLCARHGAKGWACTGGPAGQMPTKGFRPEQEPMCRPCNEVTV